MSEVEKRCAVVLDSSAMSQNSEAWSHSVRISRVLQRSSLIYSAVNEVEFTVKKKNKEAYIFYPY